MHRFWATTSPLPAVEFQRRHRGLVWLLVGHLIALPIFGVLMGWSLAESLITVTPAATFCVFAVAPRLSQTGRAISCVLGLLSCSAALVWLWHGQTEAHFHYFVIVGAVAIYEAWLPFAIAFAFVVLQHGLMSLWVPSRVYGSMVAMDHPWLYAGIHGGFIAALGVANMVYWRASDRTRQREQQANERALEMGQRLERAFAGAPNGIALLDDEGMILTANDALGRSLRIDADALLGRRWNDLIRSSARDAVSAPWPPTSPGVDRERRTRRADGTEGWLQVTYSRLGDADTPEWIAQTLDITRRRKAESDLEFQASHDQLTGMLNRQTFARRAQAMLDTRDGAAINVLFVDVDDFKVVNDSLGHDAGDGLLIAVAERLRSVIRREDLIGRFGGDEFVVCLSEPSPAGAEATARRMSGAFATPFLLAGVERTVTASVGLALAHSGEHSMDSLLRDADLAMYEAKAGGKARHAWFDVEMRKRAVDRLELESDLRTAIIRGEINAHYQPQVDLDGRVVGVEALARWEHPTRGPIAPGVFIPMAERSGLVSEIGAQVLHTACNDARAWQTLDPALGELGISVNLSPQCMGDPDLPAQFGAVLRETGVAPERVCIEITETGMIDRDGGTLGVVDAFKELGVRIAIDDFGIGHSSLAQLTRLSVIDELKIDKTLVDGVAGSPAAQRIIKAVIDVAVGDGLDVVVEGVETKTQLDALRRLGRPIIQGFLFSHPVPADELPQAVAAAQRIAATVCLQPAGVLQSPA